MRLFSLVAISTFLACSSGDNGGDGDGGVRDSGVASCPTPSAGPTMHPGTTLSASETWRADGSPHIVMGELTVGTGVVLTIEPCAEVRLPTDRSLIVNGRLSAMGSDGRPIIMRNHEAGARFASLWIRAPGSAELAYVEMEGGGGVEPSTYGATIQVEGSWPPSPLLGVDHVTIRGSAGHGIWLSDWATFTAASRDLVIVGSGSEIHPYPLRTTLNTVQSIPSGTYTGNRRDEIQVVSESPHYKVEIDDRFLDRGVPYRIGGNDEFGIIEVSGSPLATLTIDPNVTIRFESASSSVGGLFIGNTGEAAPSGRLIAIGSASSQIVLTGGSDGAVAGDWEGVTFVGQLATNQLEHVRIENAGAHGGDNSFGCPPERMFDSDGALKIFTAPSAPFVSSLIISSSSSHGVYEAWNGSPIDFVSGNTFTLVAGCHQVDPRDADGNCPTTPPCPR